MKLSIKKSEVLKEAERQSALIGSSMAEGNNFEPLWITEHEGNILNTYWVSGVGAALQLFVKYIKNESVSHDLTKYDGDEVLTIEADMPERFNEGFTGAIEDSLKLMLAYNILSGWLSAKAPDLVESVNASAEGCALDIVQKLSFRKPPLRKPVPTGLDMEVVEVDGKVVSETPQEKIPFKEPVYDELKFKQYDKCN